MKLLDGTEVSKKIRADIAAEVIRMAEKGIRPPHLTAILVGDNSASLSYITGKSKACSEAGFTSSVIKLEKDISEEKLLEKIAELNKDSTTDGIIVQLPLPKHISPEKVIEAVLPEKDVDGFHPLNIGRMAKNLPSHIPATPLGILHLLKYYHIETSGKNCVVLGRSQIVGSPVSILLARNSQPGNCTVTLCHSKTVNLKKHMLEADLLIAAIGIPRYVTADMVKEGAVVVDVGINRIEDSSRKNGYRLAGDVDFENVAPRCSYITPVPGGVGPMTVACLLLNTLDAARKRI